MGTTTYPSAWRSDRAGSYRCSGEGRERRRRPGAPAPGLGGVEGAIGGPEEIVGIGTWRRAGAGHPHARGHLEPMPVDGEGADEGGAGGSGQTVGVLILPNGGDDHELVATDPQDRVGLPHGGPQALGDGDEQVVAGVVPQRVVD